MRARPVILTVFLAAALSVLPGIVVQRANADNSRETPVVQVVRQNAAAVVNISTEQIVLLRESPSWGNYGGEFDSLFAHACPQNSKAWGRALSSIKRGLSLPTPTPLAPRNPKISPYGYEINEHFFTVSGQGSGDEGGTTPHRAYRSRQIQIVSPGNDPNSELKRQERG